MSATVTKLDFYTFWGLKKNMIGLVPATYCIMQEHLHITSPTLICDVLWPSSAQHNEISTTQCIGLILLCCANFAVLRIVSVVFAPCFRCVVQFVVLRLVSVVLWLVLRPLCCDWFPLCCANVIVLRLVSVVLHLVSVVLICCVAACFCCVVACSDHCVVTGFHCVVACFCCVVLIVFCGLFPLCGDNFVVLRLVSVVLWSFHCVVLYWATILMR